jgi:hypothetical protein
MASFHRTSVDDRSFIRGAARLLIAPATYTKPVKISDVIALASASGVALYDAASGWTDLGATKTGIQITVNNSEESFDVDQIYADISSAPTSWECSVGTQLAEVTPEKLQIAWEGSAITQATVADSPTGKEDEIGFGQPTAYTQRRLAVLFQRPNGKIRGFFFWKAQRLPQESSMTFAKTGEQQSIPMRFRILADSTVTDPYKRFFVIRDQSISTNP